MSRSRQPVVRSFSLGHPAGTIVPPQPPGWDHLLYAASGVMDVVTPTGRWVVPPTRAVWLPSGTDHRIEMPKPAKVRNLYVQAGLVDLGPEPRAMAVPPLARELVLHAVEVAPLWADDEYHQHLLAVLVHQLAALPAAPLRLPLPTDARARVVADGLLRDASAPLDRLVASSGAGRRTLERLFAESTGMSLGRWRTRARVLAALRLLAEGATTASVAAAVGYESPSAFVAMFRREVGTTPRGAFR